MRAVKVGRAAQPSVRKVLLHNPPTNKEGTYGPRFCQKEGTLSAAVSLQQRNKIVISLLYIYIIFCSQQELISQWFLLEYYTTH